MQQLFTRYLTKMEYAVYHRFDRKSERDRWREKKRERV